MTTETSKQTPSSSKHTAVTSKQNTATSKEVSAVSEKTDVTPENTVKRVDKEITARNVKRIIPKKCGCLRIARSAESLSNDLDTERGAQFITQAIYPGVNCGHKNCLQYPITTPRNMGWLWSLRETGGVKVSGRYL